MSWSDPANALAIAAMRSWRSLEMYFRPLGGSGQNKQSRERLCGPAIETSDADFFHGDGGLRERPVTVRPLRLL